MKTTIRLASALVALSALLSALPASAAPLSVERIIAADQANDDGVVLASSKKDGKWQDGTGSDDNNGESNDDAGDNDGNDGNDGEGPDGNDGEGPDGDGEGPDGNDGEGSEGGDHD